MRNMLAIARKELTVYLTTPWAWVVFTGMSFVSSVFFLVALVQFKSVHDRVASVPGGWSQVPPDFQNMRNLTDGVVLNLFGVILVVTLFAAPFLSMRLLAEERRQKTFELLMTTPTRALDIVLGKYLGAVGIVVCTLSVTLVYPLILSVVGSSESGAALEWSTVMLGYLALLLWGSTCMAIGLFVSSLTESQMIAAMITFAILLVWWVGPSLLTNVDEPLRGLINYLSFDRQIQNLLRGVLDLKPIILFTSVSAFFLMLTHRSIEARRWT